MAANIRAVFVDPAAPGIVRVGEAIHRRPDRGAGLGPMTIILVACRECDRQISIAAHACPYCGRSTGLIGTPFVDPPPSDGWFGIAVLILVLVIELAAFFGACNVRH
jgi:hypothetical protein